MAVPVRPDQLPLAVAMHRCLEGELGVPWRWFALREWVGLPAQRMGL
jgi:hypothetical protein